MSSSAIDSIPVNAWFISKGVYFLLPSLTEAFSYDIEDSYNCIGNINGQIMMFDFGKKKAFPMRTQHFFADIHKAKTELDWQPEFDLISGLKDSYQNDYLKTGRDQAAIDFSLDDQILA